MQILVTGGAGFIGSHTVEALLGAGHTVRVIDNLSTGNAANLPADVELIVGDVCDLPVVQQAIAGCTAVIHLAALVSVPQSLTQPLQTYTVNTTGTAYLLDAARQANVRRVVLASTCAVYGNKSERITEATPVDPLVPYATSKLLAEQLMHMYARCYGIETVCLRYFNVYGLRQQFDSPYSGVIARWSAAVRAGQPCTVYGDGTQTRDFVAVRDVAQANLLALTAPLPQALHVFNVASGRSISLNHLLETLGTILHRDIDVAYAPARAGEILHSSADTSRLRQMGWQPETTLAQALTELLA